MDDKAWEMLKEDIKEIKTDVKDMHIEFRQEIKDIKKDTSKLRMKITSISSIVTVLGTYFAKKLGL